MHGQTILVVDDDRDFLDTLGMRLTGSGYKVLTAVDGNQGMEIARKIKPDLIILDIMMPGKDGLATERDLVGITDTMLIPVIVVTAHADKKKKRRAAELGAVAFLTKPFDDDVLLNLIRSNIG